MEQESRKTPHSIKKDTRRNLMQKSRLSDPQLRVVSKVGGLMIFSAAQMHSTVPTIQDARALVSILEQYTLTMLLPSVAQYGLCCTGTTLGTFCAALIFPTFLKT